MGAELLLFSYVLGLVPISYGLHTVIAGRVYLTSLSKEPVRGTRARLLGFVSLGYGLGPQDPVPNALFRSADLLVVVWAFKEPSICAWNTKKIDLY